MTQKDKEQLLKDLCGRMPYGVMVNINGEIDILTSVCDDDGYYFNFLEPDNLEGYTIDEIKPFLFPMSSMTEEQKREYNSLRDFAPTYFYEYGDIVEDKILYDNFESIDYLNANHFDYRGLIVKGLAIDATNLNIY